MNADFIDSNIFVYLFDETDEFKRNAAERLVHNALKSSQGCISYQVVQETLNVITRKLLTPVTPEDAKLFLDIVLVPLWKVNPDAALYRRGLDIQMRYRYGFYDALIVAAALETECSRLFSEDLQHNQKIENLTIVNPFLLD